MIATSGKACLALTFAAVLLATQAARAGSPSPADVATARELYKKGADALDAGDAKSAADKLAQAWALVQTPVIGYDLARAQSALGHLVEAREAALAVQRLPIAHDETARSTEARNDSAKIAAQLEPRIPHVTLDVRGLAGHEATVKLDGAVVPSAALSVARQANPGSHVAIVDTDDGRHAESTISLAERDSKSIVLELGEPKAPPVTTPPPPPPLAHVETPPQNPVVAAPEQRGGLSPLFWIGLATTGVGVATGAITGAFAVSEAQTVKNDCTTQINGVNVCGPSDTGHLSAANTLGVVSTVGFIVGGVGIAILVTGLALGPSHKGAPKGAWVMPFIGPVSGLGGAF